MSLEQTVTELVSDPEFRVQMHAAQAILASGVEPGFFAFENETNSREFEFSPVYSGGPVGIRILDDLLSYASGGLDPDEAARRFTEGDLELSECLENTLSRLRVVTHLHPDGVLEPSVEDLILAESQRETACQANIPTPIHIIGATRDGILECLAFLPLSLPNESQLAELPVRIEARIIEMVLPNFIARSTLPEQEARSEFMRQFGKDFTVFPEYPSCVMTELRNLGAYEVVGFTL